MILARESRQHQQAVRVLRTYRMLSQIATGPLAERMRHDVAVMQAELDELPACRGVRIERENLLRAVDRATG